MTVRPCSALRSACVPGRQQPGAYSFGALARHLRHRQRGEPVQGLEHGVHPVLHGRRTLRHQERRHRSRRHHAAAVRRLPEHAEVRRPDRADLQGQGGPGRDHRRQRRQLRRRAQLQHGAGRVRQRCSRRCAARLGRAVLGQVHAAVHAEALARKLGLLGITPAGLHRMQTGGRRRDSSKWRTF